jgi:hypothetical protein
MSDETDNNLEPPKKTFDRFDGRGTYLSEVLVFFHGASIDRELLLAHGVKVSFVPKKRREARWFAKEIYLLPELLQQGAWFASVEVRSLGPEFSETYWTLRLAVAPDDDPPEDMRERAFPGTFPGNLPALLRLGRIDGPRTSTCEPGTSPAATGFRRPSKRSRPGSRPRLLRGGSSHDGRRAT